MDSFQSWVRFIMQQCNQSLHQLLHSTNFAQPFELSNWIYCTGRDYYGNLDADYSNLYIKDTINQGRVLICIGGQYTKFASVVCKQLGFSPYGELRIDQGKYYNLTLEPSL